MGHADDVGAFAEALARAAADRTVQSIVALACDANGFTAAQLDPVLASVATPIIGGIFPALIHGREKLETGYIILGLRESLRTVIVPDLSGRSVDYAVTLEGALPIDESIATAFVFVDGLAGRIAALIDGVFQVFGLEFTYIGGGAGSLSLEQKPCVFTNAGLVADHAIIGLTTAEGRVEVRHGWEPVQGPFSVTESAGNRIISLDWTPAFDVYRAVVEPLANVTISADNFFDVAKGFPFGLVRLNAEHVVRDPISVDGTDLVCVGEIPDYAVVDIMRGSGSGLIGAAREAGAAAAARATDGDAPIFFVDCISRVLYLDTRFQDELDAVAFSGRRVVGALTLGEIAGSGRGYLEFYNKTAVVGVLEVQ